MPRSMNPGETLCAEAGNALVEAMNSAEPQVRRAVMTALGRLRYANAAPALADQFGYYQRGPDAEAALEGLAGIGHDTSRDIFKRTLGNPDADMRRIAVEGLAVAGSRTDLPDLERLGQSERANAVLLALQYASLKLGAPFGPDRLMDLSPSMAPALAESLRNPDNETRMLVADVLGFSGDPRVIPALEAAAKDADSDAARAAQRAIDRIKLAESATPGGAAKVAHDG